LVTDESPLKILFRTLELEQLVCGQRNYDWTGLKKGCKYDGGFHENHHTVLYFWEVFDEMNESQRKTFLEFVSGSDRCPVGGLERLKMTLTKNGPDSNRLPSAHTCFNVLLLPEYSSKSFLKERMMKALENSMGFGMM
jgi:ubiquitin-protein ligase E3 A